MFEETILVLKITDIVGGRAEPGINIYEVKDSRFVCVAVLPVRDASQEAILRWLKERGCVHAVSFAENDGISGLWRKE